MLITIFVDADACPVKKEIFAVARKYNLKVYLVANSWLRIPQDESIELIVVGNKQLDEADDWIADHISAGDIAITSDVPLAARCLEKDASVLDAKGHVFTKESIGGSLANRNLMTYLREMGDYAPGQAPYDKRDRSKFLQYFNQIIQTALRKKGSD